MPARISYRIGPVFPDVDWGAFQWAILESPVSVRLAEICDPLGFAPQDFPVGTAFGDGRELRWRKRRGGAFHLVMVDDTGAALDEETARPLEELSTGTIRLWGEPRIGHWHEARIPREIGDYPAGFLGSRVGVEVVHYELVRDGRPTFLFRCKRLVKV